MIALKATATPFTPTSLLNEFTIKVKNRVIDMTDKAIIISTTKIFEIVYDESLRYVNQLLKAKHLFIIEDMKTIDFDSIYDRLEKEEEKLWELHTALQKFNSKSGHYLQLFEVLDNTLNNYAKMNNILGYFESQIIQSELKSA